MNADVEIVVEDTIKQKMWVGVIITPPAKLDKVL